VSAESRQAGDGAGSNAGVEATPGTDRALDPAAAAAERRAAEAELAEAEKALAGARRLREERTAEVAAARGLVREIEVELRHAAERGERARRQLGAPGPAGDAAPEQIALFAAGPSGRSAAGGAQGELALGEGRAAGSAGETASPAPVALAAARTAAAERAEHARQALAAARDQLAGARPEEVRAAAAAAEAAAQRAAGEQRAAEDELARVRGRLEATGERGLFDELAEARAAAAPAERRLRSVEARAAAAERLHAVFTAARDRARRAYGEPLRRRIVELGRPLFGDDFGVELDDELRIARRTLGGTTLDFDQLSAGAREQLALLARLAAALLVAPDDGVPVLIDDALGHSDPDRLAALGRILARAGESCQVIVLTCHPGRFAGIEGARVISL
jgi:hypothetical protein